MTDQTSLPAGAGPPIESVRTAVYRFPTPTPEADGTLAWDAVVAVTVTLTAAGETGLGWSYTSPAAAAVVEQHLAEVVRQHGAFQIAAGWEAMHRAGRNYGTHGLFQQALSAVDIAWWDLAGRLRNQPVADLAGGTVLDEIPLYGSGGFTTLTDDELAEQVAGWHEVGARAMKIKIGESWGARPDRDLARVRQLIELAGPGVAPMVDANGGYTIGQAQRIGHELDTLGVSWFEEPVSSEDLAGLALLRQQLRLDVAAGEYLSEQSAVLAMLPSVDCLQLDATRCGGYTGFQRAAAIAAGRNLKVSAHCGPAVHAPLMAAIPNLAHVEYFADHVRLEPLLVDGVTPARGGRLHPDLSAPGHGMRLAESAQRYRSERN